MEIEVDCPLLVNRCFRGPLLERRAEVFRSLKNAVAILANDTGRFDMPDEGSTLPPLVLKKKSFLFYEHNNALIVIYNFR